MSCMRGWPLDLGDFHSSLSHNLQTHAQDNKYIISFIVFMAISTIPCKHQNGVYAAFMKKLFEFMSLFDLASSLCFCYCTFFGLASVVTPGSSNSIERFSLFSRYVLKPCCETKQFTISEELKSCSVFVSVCIVSFFTVWFMADNWPTLAKWLMLSIRHL